MFEIERIRERKRGYSLHKGTQTLVRDREKFEIEVFERERESQLYKKLEEFKNSCCYCQNGVLTDKDNFVFADDIMNFQISRHFCIGKVL